MKIQKSFPAVLIYFVSAIFSFAQTWTQIGTSISNWDLAAMSADGTKLFATTLTQNTGTGIGVFPGDANPIFTIYTSTNSGNTWTQIPQITNWTSIASSADGTKLVVGAGGIYFSTNSGTTWSQSDAPTNFWHSIASSSDGNKLIAGAYGGLIYLSTDAGNTWLPTGVPMTNSFGYSNYWLSVASSADGNVLAAVAGNWEPGAIYVSTNSGTTWLEASAPITNWWTVAMSANGSEIIAGVGYGLIYISTNFGAAWTATSAPTSGWQSVAVSADGSKIAAACLPVNLPAPDEISPGSIYTSTNFGVDWVSNNVPFAAWLDVASSADGNELFAINHGGEMWMSQITPSPSISATQTNGRLALSWLVPSTNFHLQQSSDLQNWSAATNQPIFNLANLQEQVALPLNAGANFFRLTTQ